MKLNSTVSAQPSKKRIIIVTIVMSLIVLGLLVAVIAVAVNKATRKSPTAQVSSEVAVVSDDSTDDSGNVSEENLAPVSNSDESGLAQSAPTQILDDSAAQSNSSQLPTTGPEDLLPLALLLGAAVTYLASCLCARAPRVL